MPPTPKTRKNRAAYAKLVNLIGKENASIIREIAVDSINDLWPPLQLWQIINMWLNEYTRDDFLILCTDKDWDDSSNLDKPPKYESSNDKDENHIEDNVEPPSYS